MRKTITFLFIFLLSGMSIAFAQNAVRGTVTDKSGAPLPGVTVKVKGTQNGTQTDANGHYSVNAASNSTLVFSFIGYVTQEVPVDGRTAVNVSIADAATGLNEVVVIGYGTQKKATVTGAISSVGSDDLKDQQVTRVEDALQGRAAGVLVTQSSGAPGSSPSIIVRGYNSFSNSSPLYVIDGQVWDNGGYDSVNPNDIESIQVLKDASAAIYGAKSSNGVILITTKHGKSGAPKLNYNFYYGSQSVLKKLDLANATQYATLRNEAVTNDGGTAPFANPSQYGVGTNWENEIFGSAPIMQTNLSVSGGSETANYYTSIGYLNQGGIVTPSNSDYKKMTFKVNTSFKPKKYLTFGENFNYAYIRSTTSFNTNSLFGGPLSDAINLDPITPVAVSDINSQPNAAIYNTNASYILRNAQGQPYGISPYVAAEIVNPIADEQLLKGDYGWSHTLQGDAFLQIEPIKGLTIKSDIAAKQAFYGSESFTPLYYLNTFRKNVPPGTNNQYRQMNQNLEWNWDNTITYTRSVGKHNFTILAGESAEEESGYGVGAVFYDEPVSTYNQASFNFGLPQANRVANAYDSQPYTRASLFGRVTYDYDGKYLVQGIFRHDGSSKFGSDRIYGNFPSVSAGWVASKENFFPKNSFVDYLKLRASYGIMGNEQALDYFQYSPIVSAIGSYVFGPEGSQTLVTGYGPQTLPNPLLQWERDKQTDIALDATIFHDFTLTVDWYNKVSDGLLMQISLPAYAGVANAPYQNAGGVTNKGIELQLGYNKRIGDVSLSLNGNISHNKNEVTSLNVLQFINNGGWQGASTNQQRTVVGKPIYSYYVYQVLGIFQNQDEINNYKNADGTLIQPNAHPGDFKYAHPSGTGSLGPSDRVFDGSPFPTWTYGFNLSASYKNFDALVFGQGVWGNKIFQEYRRLDINAANYPAAAVNAWTPSNTNTSYPRLSDKDPNGNFSNPSTFYLQSGAYFRVKSAQLGYTLPKWIDNKLDISKLRIYVAGDNLATVTKYNGYDPEINTGLDQGVFPAARTVRVGVDVTL
ncbi:MAG: SusC/RagA family TonB-linked outer membrane protein [Mucilaginibacter sp.]